MGRNKAAAPAQTTGPTFLRGVLALGAGALAGGVASTAAWVVSGMMGGGAGPLLPETFSLFMLGVIASIVGGATLGWFSGLVVIGAPFWLLFHRLGLTSRLHAMLLGAMAAGAAGYVLGIFARAPHPIGFFIVFAIIGMGVGFLVRKLAYPASPKASRS